MRIELIENLYYYYNFFAFRRSSAEVGFLWNLLNQCYCAHAHFGTSLWYPAASSTTGSNISAKKPTIFGKLDRIVYIYCMFSQSSCYETFHRHPNWSDNWLPQFDSNIWCTIRPFYWTSYLQYCKIRRFLSIEIS